MCSNTKQQAVKVFVVSLARAADRRTSMVNHLRELGVDFTLIDAVDGKALSDGDVEAMLAPGIQLHRGAIGCYLSHVNVYKEMKRLDLPFSLVLEDDARLSARCLPLLQKGIVDQDFDYCFLDSDPHNDRGKVYYDVKSGVALSTGVVSYALSSGPQTTHAYLISLAGALKRLDCAFPIRESIDLYWELPYSPRFRAVTRPKLAWLSPHSLQSFTSKRDQSIAEMGFLALRRFEWFYALRDFLGRTMSSDKTQVEQLIRQGLLPASGRWQALPAGRNVLVR